MEMRERFERRRRVRFEKFETARVLRRQDVLFFFNRNVLFWKPILY